MIEHDRPPSTGMATRPRKSTVVEIRCPRCGGQGFGPWKPANGRCYRCAGTGWAHVKVEAFEAALRHLRARYAALRDAVASGDTESAEALARCESDGLRTRRELDEAKRILAGGAA